MSEEDIKKLEERFKDLSSEPNEGEVGREKVRVLNELALAYYPSNLPKTNDYASQALALAEKQDYKKGIAESYRILGISCALKGDYDKALERYSRALKIFEEVGDNEGAANCYNNIGLVHKNRGDYDEALEYQRKALGCFEEIRDRSGVAYSYKNIGLIHDKRGSYDQALEYYIKALKIFEREGDKQGIAVCSSSIGVVYKKEADYGKALEYYLKALKVFTEIGNKQFTAHTYNNIGIIYKNQNDYDRALEYHLKALKMFAEIGDRRGIANSYGNLGVIHDKQGSYDQALEHYIKALEIFSEIGDRQSIAISYGNIGHVHTQLRRYDSALGYLEKGLELAQEIGAKDWEMQTYGYFSELYEAQGDFKTSLSYYKKYSLLKEKVFSEESTEKIAQMQTRYEIEKKEREAEIYRLRNVELEAEITERKRAEVKIKASLAEKEVLLKEVHHRVKNNLQVISSLLNLQAGYVTDERILNMLESSQSRIESMALIHEKLYQSEDLARIDFRDYLVNLTRSLFASYKVAPSAVALQLNVADVLLGIDKAIPLALIINELISNSLEHAFPEGEEGEIAIDLCEDGENFTLTVADNGVGLPQGFDFQKTKSLGLRLVGMLVDQLKGSFELTKGGGTGFKIIFPVKKPRPQSNGQGSGTTG